MPALRDTLSKAEIAALKSIATEQIDLEQAIEQQRREQREAEAAEAARRKELEGRLATLQSNRLDAVAEAEQTARRLTECFKAVEAVARDEGEALAALGRPNLYVRPDSVRRRLGRYLSGVLRALIGPTAGRYGEIDLARGFQHRGVSWKDLEARETSIPIQEDQNHG